MRYDKTQNGKETNSVKHGLQILCTHRIAGKNTQTETQMRVITQDQYISLNTSTQHAHTHLRGGSGGAEGAAHMRGTARQVPGEQACSGSGV